MAAKSTIWRFIIGSVIAGALGIFIGLMVLGALIYLAPGGGIQSKTNDNRIVSASPTASVTPAEMETPKPTVIETGETPEATPIIENTPPGTTANRTPQVADTPRLTLTPRRTPVTAGTPPPRVVPTKSVPNRPPVSIPTVHP